MGKVTGLFEDLQTASRHGVGRQIRMFDGDNGVVPPPDHQRRHAFGEVGTVQHGDDLAPPIDTGAKCAENGSTSSSIGQGVEDIQYLLSVASEIRPEEAEELGG